MSIPLSLQDAVTPFRILGGEAQIVQIMLNPEDKVSAKREDIYKKVAEGIGGSSWESFENELLSEEVASSCSPTEICLKKLHRIPGYIKGRAASTKHVLATENLRIELELEKNKSKALKEEVKRIKEEQLKVQEEQVKFQKEQAKFKEEQLKFQEEQNQMKDKMNLMMAQLSKLSALGSQN
ncbi:hypothetical protein L6452_06810 [Arctium lappa]|uniref:Uncharacterized protein n=1 Tax=Arctium lappa TaxID=4217 RepID=A0ACB9EKR2_ARCLA|nr:hypothetical protein L6452_06810 [Arctium lappa]